jgi:hypothetical protein
VNEFIRDNVVFVAKGSKLDPLNQRCTIVEYFPAQTVGEQEGQCHQIMLDLDEADKLHSYLEAWLQENK